MTEERKLPRIDYSIPAEEVKKINELLAPIGWSVGRIFRARNIEINDLAKELETARYMAEWKAREAGDYCPGFGYISEDPEFKKAYEAYKKLFYEE